MMPQLWGWLYGEAVCRVYGVFRETGCTMASKTSSADFLRNTHKDEGKQGSTVSEGEE